MNDITLLDTGIKCLSENLGLVEAERFIALLMKDPFNYTEWRKNHLCVGMSVKDISEAAKNHWEEKYAQ